MKADIAYSINSHNRPYEEIFISKKIHKNALHTRLSFFISLALHILLISAYIYTQSQEKHIDTFAPATKPVEISLALWEPKAAPSKPAPKLPEVNKNKIQKETHQKTEAQKATQKNNLAKKKALQQETPKPLAQPRKELQQETLLAKASPSQEMRQPQQTEQAQKVEETQTQSVEKSAPPVAQKRAITPDMLSQIRALIQSTLRYPPMAKRLGIEGVTVVAFVLSEDGEVKEANIYHSSGNNSLDSSALRSVLNLSGNYPRPEKSVDLRIPIAFSIKNS